MKVQSETDFDGLVRASKLLATVAAWQELGLFEALANREGPVNLANLPGDTRALTISAAVLAHAGLLDGSGQDWTLSAIGRALFDGKQLAGPRELETLTDLGKMAEVLRHGGPVRDSQAVPKLSSGGVIPTDRERTRQFLDMLYRRSEHSAEVTAEWVARRLPPTGRVLDVGGGHGRYAEAFVRRGFAATVFDLPPVVELARERHGDRLTYRSGNFHQDDLQGPFDAILLSNIVHGESPSQNAALIERCFAALESGGWLVLKDMFIDEQGREPENAVFFGLTMLFYTAAGQSYRIDDVRDWCRRAGFEAPESMAVDTFCLVFAKKPGA